MTDNKARAALEAQKAQLLKAHADVARAAKERKFAVRYHKVKFFGAWCFIATLPLPPDATPLYCLTPFHP